MRVDPFYTQKLTTYLDQSSQDLQQLTQEMSSGLRVTSLSIDPLAASQSSLLNSSINQQDSFVQVATGESGRLQATDGALGEVVTQLTRAISVGTQASNGTNNAGNLVAFAGEVAGIRDTVLSLSNSTYTGTYLFSGSQGTTQPFTLNTVPTPATTSYAGDAIPATVTTPAGQTIQVSLPGGPVFTPVLSALNQLIADLGASAGSTAISADTAALSASLNNLDSQRSQLDNNLNRLQSTSTYAQTQSAQLTVAQGTLVGADTVAVATQLSATEVQHQALLNVIASLASKQDLFDYIK